MQKRKDQGMEKGMLLRRFLARDEKARDRINYCQDFIGRNIIRFHSTPYL